MSGINMGSKNGQWKGDKVGYAALHEWARKYVVMPPVCEMCKTKYPHDLANISGEYKRDLSDWQWLCRSCHMKSDGRLKKLNHSKSENLEVCPECSSELVTTQEYRNEYQPPETVASCNDCGYTETT